MDMDLFQIVVITIVAVASGAVIAGFVVMVVGSERRAQGGGRSRTRIAPGWYPDAQDESLLRYFDGRVPTQKTAKREVI